MSNFEEHVETYSAEEMTERADYLGELEEDRHIIEAAEEQDRKRAAEPPKAQDIQFEIEKARADGYHKARQDIETILLGWGTVFLSDTADFSDVDQITFRPILGDDITYDKARRGYWEPMDREDYPLIHPMRVCSACQKVNHYPGQYCTYCGSFNSSED